MHAEFRASVWVDGYLRLSFFFQCSKFYHKTIEKVIGISNRPGYNELWSTIEMERTLTSDMDHLGDIAYPTSKVKISCLDMVY